MANIPEGLGQKEGFVELGMRLVSHPQAEFSEDTNKFEVLLKGHKDKPVKTLAKLEQVGDDGEFHLVEKAVFVQLDDTDICYDIAVSKPGKYKLNLFAAPKSEQSDSVPGIFTYLFSVNKVKETVYPYPKQFADWKDGCRLYNPLTIDTSKNLDKVKFKVKIPGAKKVAVKVGEAWFHLVQGEGAQWKGEVRLTEYHTKNAVVSLNASMDGSNNYATLLTYSKA